MGGYDPALMDWSGIAPGLFDDDVDSVQSIIWLDDGGIFDVIVPPVVEYQRSGGWLPVIYVDRNGNEVDLAQAVEIAADVAPPEERQEIEAIAGTIAPLLDGAFISAQIAADMARVVEILDGFDAILAEAIRRDIITARQAAIDDETALILLMAT